MERVRENLLSYDGHHRRSAFDLIARVLAERLRRLEASEDLRVALACRCPTQWKDIVVRARSEYVLPAFAAAVRDLDLIGSLEPKLRAFLAITHIANVQRNNGLRDQLVALAGVLNRAGIEPVLLKGAIRLVDGLYPDPGWRTMSDLDLLVPEARFADAIGALQGAGYTAVCAVEPDRKDVKLQRQGLANVEIHRELFWTTRKQRLLRGAEVIGGSRPATIDGTMVRLPSIEHQLVHLIGHSQIGHFNHVYGRVALRDRLEAAALVHRLPQSIDWEAVYTRFAAAGYRRPLLAFLLSLGDGGLCTAPTPSRIDALTTLQQHRIALQARSEAMMRISLYIGWYTVLLEIQIVEHKDRWSNMARTLKNMAVDRNERRRLIRTLFHGGPRPW